MVLLSLFDAQKLIFKLNDKISNLESVLSLKENKKIKKYRKEIIELLNKIIAKISKIKI